MTNQIRIEVSEYTSSTGSKTYTVETFCQGISSERAWDYDTATQDFSDQTALNTVVANMSYHLECGFDHSAKCKEGITIRGTVYPVESWVPMYREAKVLYHENTLKEIDSWLQLQP